MAFSEADRKRMLWHSRRGMLELDLVLGPFAEHCLGTLDERRLGQYRALLDQEDQDLFGWFIRKETPDTVELSAIVEHILTWHQQTRGTLPRTSGDNTVS